MTTSGLTSTFGDAQYDEARSSEENLRTWHDKIGSDETFRSGFWSAIKDCLGAGAKKTLTTLDKTVGAYDNFLRTLVGWNKFLSTAIIEQYPETRVAKGIKSLAKFQTHLLSGTSREDMESEMMKSPTGWMDSTARKDSLDQKAAGALFQKYFRSLYPALVYALRDLCIRDEVRSKPELLAILSRNEKFYQGMACDWDIPAADVSLSQSVLASGYAQPSNLKQSPSNSKRLRLTDPTLPSADETSTSLSKRIRRMNAIMTADPAPVLPSKKDQFESDLRSSAHGHHTYLHQPEIDYQARHQQDQYSNQQLYPLCQQTGFNTQCTAYDFYPTQHVRSSPRPAQIQHTCSDNTQKSGVASNTYDPCPPEGQVGLVHGQILDEWSRGYWDEYNNWHDWYTDPGHIDTAAN